MSKVPESPASGPDIIRAIVENHRLNNGFVCPYAKLVATTKVVPAMEDTSAFQKAVGEGLEEFHREKPASLIFIHQTHPKNHEEGRHQTETLFDHLSMAALKIRPGVIIDPRTKKRTFSIIPFGNDKLLAIGLNPLYPPEHPRYSPEPIMSVTRVSDVLKLSEMQTLTVRQKAIRRMIQAMVPHLSMNEIEAKTNFTIVGKRNLTLDVDIDDSIATPEMLKAVEYYGMNVPLYLMPGENPFADKPPKE